MCLRVVLPTLTRYRPGPHSWGDCGVHSNTAGVGAAVAIDVEVEAEDAKETAASALPVEKVPFGQGAQLSSGLVVLDTSRWPELHASIGVAFCTHCTAPEVPRLYCPTGQTAHVYVLLPVTNCPGPHTAAGGYGKQRPSSGDMMNRATLRSAAVRCSSVAAASLASPLAPWPSSGSSS